MRNAIRALFATVVFAFLTGLIYPLALTVVARVVFTNQADGSPITVDGKVVGSALIGQPWDGPEWFYGRPSAIAEPYDASASSGSNLGPLSQALADAITERVQAIVELEGPYHPGLTAAAIPVDLLTASSSGLDPDISPAAAIFQAPRIAAERQISLQRVLALIDANTSGRTLGFLGEPRVNVLELNLALEAQV
ncbi:MAG TPA: potassium-transporting ATPase subunit KdpC [Actinomycetota bacterium]